MRVTESTPTSSSRQAELYRNMADQYGRALERLARAYEADADKRRDLIQEIHFQLWRSFAQYDSRCSIRTWTYRVAHNVATSHVLRERRFFSRFATLDEIEKLPDRDASNEADNHQNLARLSDMIRRLKPLDRQVIVCYLEEMDAAAIGEITGLSAPSVAMRIHRIKIILARWFREGDSRVA